MPVTVYGEGETMTAFGGCQITLQTTMTERSVQPVLLLSLDAGEGGRIVYCGSAVFESGLAEDAASLVSSADTVIFGNHGPRIKSPYGGELTLLPDATVILSKQGDVAAWFEADAVNEQKMWLGEWQGEMKIESKKLVSD